MSEANKAAVALGKLRWAGVSAEDRAAEMRERTQQRNATLTPAQRRAIAKKAAAASAKARSAKKKAKKVSRRKSNNANN